MGVVPEEGRKARRLVEVSQRRGLRWVRFLALALVAALLLAAGGGYGFARRSLPQVAGELSLPGLTAPVSVYRDEWGVPHIEATTIQDLYMAQGYVTAQDRLWQMDLTRRTAAGRLSEVFGSGYIPTDKFLRTLLLRRSAERSVQAYSAGTIAVLEAYAAGVNAYVDQAVSAGTLPVEFTLLGYTPEPWTPVDSASIGKLMAYDLGGNFASEVYRYQVRDVVDEELFRELLPVYPSDAPTIMRYQGAVPDQRQTAELAPALGELDLSGLLAAGVWPEEHVGSNNWVVSGQLTASGKPLLANDPHLGLQLPAIWHQVHLVMHSGTEPLNVIGVMFPGAPGIIIGHNEHIAWGVTNTGPDVQDLYIEKRNPENPYQFEYQGKWQDALVYPEPIRVKGEADVPFEVVVTRHGPIVSEIVGSKENRPKEALALRWTAHNPTTELEAVVGLNRARNWAEFRQALKAFEVPTQNFVFAAADGTIAYRANGLIPVRAKGEGLLPVPGWTGDYEWTGYIPFDEMPEVVNPPEGLIATANHKVVDDAYPYLLGTSWAEPYRGTRIVEALQGRQGLTADDMRVLQADYANLRARTMLPLLLPHVKGADLTDLEQKALDLLAAWDYVDAADRGAPLVFHFWWRHLTQELYQERMGKDLFGRMSDKGAVTTALVTRAAKGQEGAWVKAAGGLPQVSLKSFKAAVAAAADLQGRNPSAWKWGKYHRIGPQHPIGKAVKPLGWLLNARPLPVGGSEVTVAAMGYNAGTGLVSSTGVWRQVVDFGNLAGNSGDVVTPGQSGHFLSPWYTSQAELHQKGNLHRQLFLPADYRSGQKLTLTP